MGIFRRSSSTDAEKAQERNKVRSIFREPATVENCRSDYENAADVRDRFDKAAKRQHRR